MDKKMIFLLGGYDLEMLEIKEILNKKNINYEDKKLTWGAKLSDYKDVLEKYEDKELIIYGIELESDITLPKNYVEIDHHGKNDDKPSSLEQVAEILNIKLSSEQKLIAANDSRYIAGMKNLCIDNIRKEDIDNIRKKDREAQGITADDELLAKESFVAACNNNSNLIYSKTSEFSAVSDLAYEKFDNYVIYDDTKIVFYGYKKDNILEFLKSQNIDESNYYYGGGEFGFVGIKKNILNDKLIDDLIEKFKNLKIQEKNIYSYHTFMLPFRFDKIIGRIDDKNKYYKEKSIDDRIKITNNLKKSLEEDGWEHKPFKIETNFDYNEYGYFYDFIRETLYNKKTFEENETSYYFEKPYTDGKFYLNAKNQNFELDFEGISLRLFDTGIGIFTIELANKKVLQSDINSILKINDFARRIYPQYLGKWENHANWTQAPKNSILPTSIKINLPNKEEIIENFCEDYKDIPISIKISDYILTLLGKQTFTDLNENNKYFIQPIIDDRMFVLSWYGNTTYSETLKNYKYIKDDKWYEYVFIDGDGKTIHSPNMQEELIKKSTYDRWMNHPNGLTLYGITRYSFVCLTGNSSFSKEVLPLPHVKTMYFQMFTLLLAIRASTLRFSQEVTALSDIEKEDTNLSENISNLYKNYIRFVNKIYFREITAQEQGIEIYNKACELMKIHEDVKDLNSEIEKLHSYSDLIEEKSRNDKLSLISKIGAILLPPSLLAGLFGMNILMIVESNRNQAFAFILIVLSGLIGFLFTTQKTKIINFTISIFIILVVVFGICSDKKDSNKSQEVKITDQPIEVTLSDKKGEK